MGFHGKRWTDAMRLARHGSVASRFAAKVEADTNGGCWLWSGTLVPTTGYGQMQVNGKGRGAHRLSFELHCGPVPVGLAVLHKCDVRACVNPAHLYAGTAKDNMRDTIVRGRRRVRHGDTHGSAKLRASDIPAIRARLRAGNTCLSIARDYGVTDGAINAIHRGRSWWHVPDSTAARDVAGDNPVTVAP